VAGYIAKYAVGAGPSWGRDNTVINGTITAPNGQSDRSSIAVSAVIGLLVGIWHARSHSGHGRGTLLQLMDRSRLLVVVSAAQLASGVTGMVVALRRTHPYDVFWMHGQPDEIARDTIFKGTALSAPGVKSPWPRSHHCRGGQTAKPARRTKHLAGSEHSWSPAI
jgi:hypothetical protein